MIFKGRSRKLHHSHASMKHISVNDIGW